MTKIKRTSKTFDKQQKRTVMNIITYDDAVPAWMFDKIDRGGDFRFDINRDDFDSKELINKMISYSGMTWKEIVRQTHDDKRSKHHYLKINDLSKPALSRLKVLGLEEDSDQIFSFAFNNKLRIIGLREKDKFHLLWYDKEHQVCFSHKKHT